MVRRIKVVSINSICEWFIKTTSWFSELWVLGEKLQKLLLEAANSFGLLGSIIHHGESKYFHKNKKRLPKCTAWITVLGIIWAPVTRCGGIFLPNYSWNLPKEQPDTCVRFLSCKYLFKEWTYLWVLTFQTSVIGIVFSHYRPLESLLQNTEHLFQHLSTLWVPIYFRGHWEPWQFPEVPAAALPTGGISHRGGSPEEPCFWRYYRLLAQSCSWQYLWSQQAAPFFVTKRKMFPYMTTVTMITSEKRDYL